VYLSTQHLKSGVSWWQVLRASHEPFCTTFPTMHLEQMEFTADR